MKHLENLARSTDFPRLQTFLDAAAQGRVSDLSRLVDADGVRSVLNHRDPRVVFQVIRLLPEWVRQGVVTIEEIAGTAPFDGIPEGHVEQALSQNPIRIMFPVVQYDAAIGKRTGTLAHAWVFPWDAPRSVSFPRSASLPPIVPGSQKTAFVVFDRATQGDSGQLAVAVALASGRASERVLFSGTVGRDGSVGPVDYWEEKEAACRRSHRVLLGADHVQAVKQAVELTFSDPMDVPIFVHVHERPPGDSYEKLLDAVALRYPASGLFQLLGVGPEALCHVESRMLSPTATDWRDTIAGCRAWLHTCMARLPHRRMRFHLGFRIPTDLALALGCITRGKKTGGIVPYQYQEQAYHPVGSEEQKVVPVPKMRVVTEHFGGDTGNVPVIGVKIGPADMKRDLARFCRENRCRMVLMEPKSADGTLPVGNWQAVADDLADHILDQMEARCRLVLNMPLGLAFLLGRALSFYRDIEVLHLEKGQYHPVFNLCTLKDLAL